MRYSWDIRKSDANLSERGFDFEFAALIFANTTLERHDDRHDYGEILIVAIGSADGILLTVVYTDRPVHDGDVVRRIISARVSNYRERKAYIQAVSAQR